MQTATARRPLLSGSSPCLALGWTVLLVLGLGCVSCSTGAKPDVALDAQVPNSDALPHGLPGEIAKRPILMVKAAEKPSIVARLGEQPHQSVMVELQNRAARDYREQSDPDHWDHMAHGQNAETAQANAMLAWLLDDEEAAAKSRMFIDLLPTDYGTHNTIDIHIRMAHTLIGYANAVDLLAGTTFFPASEFQMARDKLLDINRQFYNEYVREDSVCRIFLQLAQNNYNVRTAGAIGYVALAFPDAPEADQWIDWATSELDFLFGSEGDYIQSDGGVSEGPYYYNLSFGVALAFFIAYENVVGAPREFDSVCTTRSIIPGWNDHACEESAPFVYTNFLNDPTFWSTADWSLGLRLPSGQRPPLGDGRFIPLTGVALLSRYTGEGRFLWDWLENTERPMEMTYSLDLVPYHLVHVPDDVVPEPPAWTHRFLTEAGHAVFRSGWDPDARWLLLVGESGPARQAIHDHVDSTSFSLAAYGEYLLLDPGYYKPSENDNAETAQSWAHNVVLIDGRSAPDKGLLTNFGDSDAAIRHANEWTRLAYAEAHQTYQETTIERSVAFVRDRYFVVGDRLATTESSTRSHAWRLGGYAGFESGGTFEVRIDGARWERTLAGVDVTLACTAPGLSVAEPDFTMYAAPHVHEFVSHSDIGHHGVIDGRVDAVAPSFLAVLAPYRVGAVVGDDDAPLEVTSVTLPDGVVGFTVTSAEHQEVVILRLPGAPDELVLPGGAVLSTDAELAVLTLSGLAPVSLMARGTFLTLDGVERVTAPPDTPVSAGQ